MRTKSRMERKACFHFVQYKLSQDQSDTYSKEEKELHVEYKIHLVHCACFLKGFIDYRETLGVRDIFYLKVT